MNATAVLRLGTKVNGKVLYRTLAMIVLNKNGDGIFKTTSTIKKGNFLRVLVDNKNVKTVKVS